MLMVVFGAGASYNSAPSHPLGNLPLPHRPPLADELFSDRPHFTEAMAEFPRCQPIVPWLRHLRGTPLERVLEHLQEEGKEYAERYSQIAAIRYYLHFMLWKCDSAWLRQTAGITNYKTLLDQIQRWRKKDDQICIVTFNYDRILESALPVVGLQINSIEHYISHETYKVIKVHGSVDWGREVETNIEVSEVQPQNVWGVAYKMIDHVAELKISQRYRRCIQLPIAKEGNVTVFPAIAIPLENKNDFECPAEHLQTLESFIPRVTKILLVGWRATDTPFLNLLRKRLSASARGMVVAGSSEEATNIGQRLSQLGIFKENFEGVGTGFTDFVIKRQADAFLKA